MFINQIIEFAFAADTQNLSFLLVKGETDLNKTNNKGTTPLLSACQKFGNIEVVKMLVEAGADVNVCMTRNKTVKSCDKDGNPIEQGQIGTTPLMLAAMIGDEKIVNYLIEHGANKTARNNSQNTALDFARWTVESRKRLLSEKKIAKLNLNNFKNIINTLTTK